MDFRADSWIWAPPGAGSGWKLERRGVRHGTIRPGTARRLSPREARESWLGAEPVLLRGAAAVGESGARRSIARTMAMFTRLRDGAELGGEIRRRLAGQRRFEPAGESVDLGDDREIGKVHADLHRRGRTLEDLWAKLSRISLDSRDDSLRIRFSFGGERLDDWSTDPQRARAADELAEAVFPECRLLTAHRPAGSLLRRWTGGRVRYSERIVFSNAPGGGAVFHHDAEDGQLGVAYAQLSGRTAWLALSKRALAAMVAAKGDPGQALRRLDGHDPALDRLLNRTPSFTRRLVERGALFVLRAGDVLLLPSHGPDDAAWHSVFALGARPSLAHSYGLFRAEKPATPDCPGLRARRPRASST
ncbi:MAG TPA: hypothetical protein VKU85_03935 [bacterium]|nr:hypothetical protein [bacterium]